MPVLGNKLQVTIAKIHPLINGVDEECAPKIDASASFAPTTENAEMLKQNLFKRYIASK